MHNPIYTEGKTCRSPQGTTEKKAGSDDKENQTKKRSKRLYDPNDYYDYDNDKLGQLTKPKLWYLLVILKKAGISLEEVGDEMGITFLGNVIRQFKLFNLRSCNYVCFLYNYFQAVSQDDWPAKHEILKKLAKYLPKMEQSRNKAEKAFNEWWLVANREYQLRRCPQI